MDDWLRSFDRLSFWLGFLTAGLLVFLIGRLRPVLATLSHARRTQAIEKRRNRRLSDEIRLANDMLAAAQHMHLGAPLFSLDEVIIAPRLLAPPIPPAAYEPGGGGDITDWVLPPTPDWPELASHYNAPWLSPAEALRGGANLAIIARPGAGKTVALAYLAAQVIRKDPAAGSISELTPALIHIADILGATSAENDPVEKLFAGLIPQLRSVPPARLPGLVRELLAKNRLLLLVDGCDELSPEQLEQAAQWLEQLLGAHPRLRAVVTAHPDTLGRLPQLGFEPIAAATWNAAQRADLLARWSEQWNRHIFNDPKGKTSGADPQLVIGWLLHSTAYQTPLELTLKIWAALAGDARGQSPADAIEAYIRRMTAGTAAKNRAGLEQLAAQAVLSGRPVMDLRAVENRPNGAGFEPGAAFDSEPPGANAPAGGAENGRGAAPELIESGLLIKRAGERLSLPNPVLTGYLAACRLAGRSEEQLVDQPEWSGRAATLDFLAIFDPRAAVPGEFLLEDDGDILHLKLLSAGRRLRIAAHDLPWVSPVMRRLAELLQDEAAPLGARLRALSALTLSGDPGVAVLLRRLTASPVTLNRRLAALGLGMLQDAKAAPDLIRLVGERIPEIYRSAALALAADGEKAGLEAVAEMLLSGDESQCRAAAEALANHPEDGHPTLEEATRMEDPGLRRAAVFGLGRIRQAWAIEILERLRSEDSQWAVQDAAAQVLKEIEESPRLPRPLAPPEQTPWLVAFAAERGMGVSPGKPALDMLHRALREGDDAQAEAALYYIEQRGDSSALLPLYSILLGETGRRRESAYEALRSLASRGVPLPDPHRLGLR